MVKKMTLALLLISFLSIPMVSASAADKQNEHMLGLSVFDGEQIGKHSINSVWAYAKNHRWQYFMLHPVYGWKLSRQSNRWELYLEGNIGWLSFDSENTYGSYKTDTFALGISLMNNYDILKFKNWSLFAEAGGGIGYWSKSPSKKLVQPDILGLINYGAGLKILLSNNFYLRSSYRFTHTSSIPGPDIGANTDGFSIGIVKYF